MQAKGLVRRQQLRFEMRTALSFFYSSPASAIATHWQASGCWKSVLTILLLCDASSAIDANPDPHAAPKWKATDAHHCQGCVGIQGPCISGRWQRISKAVNAPHGLLFCTYFGNNGRCPRGFKNCFKRAKTHRTHPHLHLHESTRLRAHAQRHGRGREETALQLR